MNKAQLQTRKKEIKEALQNLKGGRSHKQMAEQQLQTRIKLEKELVEIDKRLKSETLSLDDFSLLRISNASTFSSAQDGEAGLRSISCCWICWELGTKPVHAPAPQVSPSVK